MGTEKPFLEKRTEERLDPWVMGQLRRMVKQCGAVRLRAAIDDIEREVYEELRGLVDDAMTKPDLMVEFLNTLDPEAGARIDETGVVLTGERIRLLPENLPAAYAVLRRLSKVR